MEKGKLINQFEEEFEAMKKDFGFKSNLEELDKIFFLKDFIAKEGFVSNQLSRQVCGRMIDLFGTWYNYLHTLVMPNPSSMLNMTESQAFSEEEKQEILLLMNKIMAQISENTLNGLTKNKSSTAKFIDDSVDLWGKALKPKLMEIIKKIRQDWIEKSKPKEKQGG